MDLKGPLSFEQQVVKLKEHGMRIFSDKAAIDFLKEVNYYRFTGYALENRISHNSSDYQPGTNFEQVKSRYCFDRDMRHILRKAIECIEIYYRTQISYWFSMSKCQAPPHDQHYDRKNYYMKENFDKLMGLVSKEENYYRDSLIIQHHKIKYGSRMPLWVLVEMMTFSTLSKLYRCMYSSEQNLIAAAVGTSAAILRNNLHCMAILRNKCAHAGRLYGLPFNPPAKFGRNFLQKHPEIRTNTLFGYIVMVIHRLPDPVQKKDFIRETVSLVNSYKEEISLSEIGFPVNYESVLKELVKRI